MNDAEAAAQQAAALESIRQQHHGRHEGQPSPYTNGHCLAYWGSLEVLNGARVLHSSPCCCPRCNLLRVAKQPVTRLAAILEINGRQERIVHCSPSHLH